MDGILSVILFLVVLVVPSGASHAALPAAEVYWKTVLPYTPMPSIIQALLSPDDAKASSSFSVRPDAWTRYAWTYTIDAGDVTENKPNGNPMLPLFFLEEELRPGSSFDRLQLAGFVPSIKFLPLATAMAIPFSTKSLPQILARFSIRPESPEAEVVKNTLAQCEDGAAANEEARRCATSLESMLDFVTSDLGTHLVQVLATTAAPAQPQHYTVAASGARAVRSSKMVACHAEPYPYAMFVCHLSKLVKAYAVPLVGKDGAEVEAVAICHMDTSKMDPDYTGFHVLNVKPGTVPVCHFLPQGNILWAEAY